MPKDLLKFVDADRSDHLVQIPLAQISMDLGEFQKSANRGLLPKHIDLLTVVSCLAFADRSIRRQRSKGWSRVIHVSVPVCEPEIWNHPPTITALRDCLYTASGDLWSFSFVQRQDIPPHQYPITDHRGKTRDAAQILLYSGGMDSVAAAAALRDPAAVDAPFIPICVTSNTHIASAAYRTSADLRTELIVLRRKSPEPLQKEPTYRTRSLVFMSAAAVMADLLKISTVLIGENGQGALGPLLVPFGDEHPYVSNSPILTFALEKLLGLLLGCNVTFKFPFLFKTKGEVLLSVRDKISDDLWKLSPSCSRQRRIAGRPPCGVCGNCLLRRLSLQASGIPDQNCYTWQNLRASTLEKAASSEPTSKNDLDIATCAAISMRELARLADGSLSSRERLQDVTRLLQQTMPPDEAARSKIEALINRHAVEWSDFLNSLGKRSWLYRIGAVHEFT